MRCGSCEKSLGRSKGAIAIFMAGDEYIFSYYLCSDCDLYTVEACRDRFMGDSDSSTLPPVSRALGDRALALIAACPSPGDKHCGCASHKALHYGTPRKNA